MVKDQKKQTQEEEQARQTQAAAQEEQRQQEEEQRAAQQSQPEENTEASYSQPATSPPADVDVTSVRRANMSEDELRQFSPAPVGGAEGSNFAGGHEGKEDPIVAGSEDYRGYSDKAKEVAPEASVDNRWTAS